MTDESTLDRAYDLILHSLMERGYALHFTELAHALGVPPEDGRTVLRDLVSSGIPAWVYPDTDQIASFAPFNNQPTQYRISVEGQQVGFAQCGFEALAVCWLYPGKDVTIEAPCLDCGEPMRLTLCDGDIREQEPAGIVPFVDVPFKHWRDNIAYS